MNNEGSIFSTVILSIALSLLIVGALLGIGLFEGGSYLLNHLHWK